MPDSQKYRHNVFHPDNYEGRMHDDILQRSSGDRISLPGYMRTPEPEVVSDTCEVSLETVTAVRSLLEDMAETFRVCGMFDLAEQADVVVELLA
tara:strand:- start:2390 stop:2671 length:282 start_codon:yes stop_codon:yes gene_type:complete